jgi:hypothetical protein
VASGYKQVIVGDFFELLGHRIFGGELARDENGDICLWRQDQTIEIKSSGSQSSYGFRLSVQQIERYQQLVTFPFSRAFYVFFAYRNACRADKRGRRRTELSGHRTAQKIHNYLAGSISWCVVVDFTIVSRWKEELPRSTTSILGHLGTETVNLKCKELLEYTNGGLWARLEALELQPGGFGVITGDVDMNLRPGSLEVRNSKFPLTAILPRAEIDRFQRRLRRRGFRLKIKSSTAHAS